MSNITSFNFNGADVRTFTFHLSAEASFTVRAYVDDAGNPWFVAADVCAALELDHTALRRLDDDEKGRDSIPTLGGEQTLNTVNESGLYSLILGGRKPEAKPFKRWVTSEVLPSIRKTGQYSANPALPALPRTFSEALRALADKTDEADRQAALLIEQAPAVAAQALLAGADGSMCITNAAKALHQRPKDLFAWLSAHRWIYKRAGTSVWLGYQDRIQAGLVEHKTTTVERSDGTEKVIEQALITPKGLAKLAQAFAVEVAA